MRATSRIYTPHTAEARAKISATLKLHYIPPEIRAHQSVVMKASHASPEVRARISAACIGKIHTGRKEKIAYKPVENDKRKLPKSDEVKKKIAATMKVSRNLPEVREKIAAATEGKSYPNRRGPIDKQKHLEGMRPLRIIFDKVLTDALIDLRVTQKKTWLEVAERMGMSRDRIRKEVQSLREQGIDI